MEPWLKVIVEWVNCLELLAAPISDAKELRDGKFYTKFVSLMMRRCDASVSNKEDIVVQFIKDKYPEFKITEKDLSDESEQVHVASLLITCSPEEPSFHRPMCSRLSHDAQIRIKSFLERVLPYEENVTRELMSEAINGLGDVAPASQSLTPKRESLRDFLNSPGSCSRTGHRAQTERNRELRRLKSELALARYEKADAQEDLAILHDKVQNLQRRLREKTDELKCLREERARLTSAQELESAQHAPVSYDECYKREADRLENQLVERNAEIAQLEDKNAYLAKKLASAERQRASYKVQLAQSERCVETLSTQIELRDRELVDLRMANEELRARLDELDRASTVEQSFEVESFLAPRSPLTPMKPSEPLSTVVEIQLQEAREEADALRSQMGTLEASLRSVTEQYDAAKEMNAALNRKVQVMLDDMQRELDGVRGELARKSERCVELESTVKSLNEELRRSVEKALALEESRRGQVEACRELRARLEADAKLWEEDRKRLMCNLECANNQIVFVESQLMRAEERVNELEREVARVGRELENSNGRNRELTEKVEKRSTIITTLESNVKCLSERLGVLESSEKQLKEANEKLREEYDTLRAKSDDYVEASRVEKETISRELDRANGTCDSLRQELAEVEAAKRELEEDRNQKQEALINSESANDKLEQDLAEMNERIYTLEVSVTDLCEQLNRYAQSAKQLEGEREKLREEYEALRMRTSADMETLSTEKERVSKELKQANTDCQSLRQKLKELAAHRDTLEKQIEQKDVDLTLRKSVNDKLNEDLLLRDERVNVLEANERDLKERLERYAQSSKELEETIEKLREDHRSLRMKTDTDLDNLNSEKEDIAKQLQSTNDKCDSLEQQLIEMRTCQRELEEEVIRQREALEEGRDAREELRKDSLRYTEQINALEEKLRRLEESKEASVRDHHAKVTESNGFIESLKETNGRLLRDLDLANERFESLKKDTERDSLNDAEQINALREQLRQLEESKETLVRDHHAKVTESNGFIESLKETNGRLLRDLDLANERFESLKEDVESTSRSKEEEMEKLRKQVHEVTAKKESLIISLKKEKAARRSLVEKLQAQLFDERESLQRLRVELKLKEKTLDALERKMEEFTTERVANELKLKEVIANLQEVRANQEAVLTVQEKALKEKSSRCEELERRLEESTEKLRGATQREEGLSTQNEELNEALKGKSVEAEELSRSLEDQKTQFEDLVGLVRESKNLILEAYPDLKDAQEFNSNEDLEGEHEANNVTDTMKSLRDEASTLRNGIRKIIEERLSERKKALESEERLNDENKLLRERVVSCESSLKECEDRLTRLVSRREASKGRLTKILSSKEDLQKSLDESTAKWNVLLSKYENVLSFDSACEELKTLQATRASLENALRDRLASQLRNTESLIGVLLEEFLSTREELRDSCSSEPTEDSYVESEQLRSQLERDEMMRKSVSQLDAELDSFAALAGSYENDRRSGKIKHVTKHEQELQARIEKLAKERKDLKDKLDVMRVRSAKLERNMDQLREEVKRAKSEKTQEVVSTSGELEALKAQLAKLEESESKSQVERRELEERCSRIDEQRRELLELNAKVEREKLELSEVNRKLVEEAQELAKRPKEEDYRNRLKEIHVKYEQKLEDMKQNMKMAYNKQVAKLNKDQRRVLEEKMESLRAQMEQQCRKHAEEINKYKAHVGGLSSKYWEVAEKLLSEQQQKQEVLQQLSTLKTQFKHDLNQHPVAPTQYADVKLERQDYSQDSATQDGSHMRAIQEEAVCENKHNVRSIQAMGNAFKTEDEEGEVFDNIYLADMKAGNCVVTHDKDRLSVLQMRNSMCRPHLKSSYTAELQFHPSLCSEEEIKTGSVTDDVFNDSLSQSLLPEHKPRKRDRTQTSYKKPGPPTPSRNGGRLSLQGNELKSPNSRILKERNVDRRTTTTPRGLKNLFNMRRQDEAHRKPAVSATYSARREARRTDNDENNDRPGLD